MGFKNPDRTGIVYLGLSLSNIEVISDLRSAFPAWPWPIPMALPGHPLSGPDPKP